MKLNPKLFLILILSAVLLQTHAALEQDADVSIEEFMERRLSQMENMIQGAEERIEMHTSGQKILTDEQLEKVEKKKKAITARLDKMSSLSEEEKMEFYERRGNSAERRAGMKDERFGKKKKRNKKNKKKGNKKKKKSRNF